MARREPTEASQRTPAPGMASFTGEEHRLAQPDDHSTASIAAWYMDDSTEDQRLPHQQTPEKPASLAVLQELGVLYWRLDADKHETDPRLAAIRKIRNYSYVEIISISKDTLPGYEQKIKTFYEEHIHADEEIRFILDGAGYFDVRDLQDRWIRIHCKKGDLVVLPEGIYHRFTLDTSNYAKVGGRRMDTLLSINDIQYRLTPAMRLFVGEPLWTPYNRPQEEHASRAKYLQQFSKPAVKA